MASYHFSIKTTGRSSGGSAVAHSAYRAGDVLTDAETGVIHDYSRKRGIVSNEIFLPPGASAEMQNRGALWDAATAAEKRKNSTLVREMEIALPNELAPEQRADLLRKICLELVEMHGVAVDAAEHLPHRDDNGNAHAHISMTTRRLTGDGFGEKSREWDDKKMTFWAGEERGCSALQYWRERVATLTNDALESAGHSSRVDHRTLEAQGIDRVALPRVPREAWQIVKAGGQSDTYDVIMASYQAQCDARATVRILDADIASWTRQINELVKRAGEEAKVAKIQAEAVAKAKALTTLQAARQMLAKATKTRQVLRTRETPGLSKARSNAEFARLAERQAARSIWATVKAALMLEPQKWARARAVLAALEVKEWALVTQRSQAEAAFDDAHTALYQIDPDYRSDIDARWTAHQTDVEAQKRAVADIARAEAQRLEKERQGRNAAPAPRAAGTPRDAARSRERG